MGTIRVAWWNLENLFDTVDDPISSDLEFTEEQGWTAEVVAAKKANLAAVLRQLTADGAPELLGVAEVEGDTIFAELLADVDSNLRVVRDPGGTPDLRGIDVSIAYDRRKLAVQDQRSHQVNLRYPTRDIFEVVFTVNDTDERLVVLASHWPSRRRGRYDSEPSRIALAENLAYLVRNHVRFDATTYLQLRAAGDIAAVRNRWETRVLLMGDFNDEPFDRSVVSHLQASSERDRVVGPTNDIDGFKKEPADYTGGDTFLYNPMWAFLDGEQSGTFFLASGPTEAFPNRYQVLDQFVVTRGLLAGAGLHLEVSSVRIIDDGRVATPTKRPRGFDRKSKRGTSDHPAHYSQPHLLTRQHGFSTR